jgi:hypothetical protein
MFTREFILNLWQSLAHCEHVFHSLHPTSASWAKKFSFFIPSFSSFFCLTFTVSGKLPQCVLLTSAHNLRMQWPTYLANLLLYRYYFSSDSRPKSPFSSSLQQPACASCSHPEENSSFKFPRPVSTRRCTETARHVSHFYTRILICLADNVWCSWLFCWLTY